MTNQHDLEILIQQASTVMQSEYDRIFSTTTLDPGTAGDQGETNWKTFLENWLPSHFHIETKGRIMGANGALSDQIDIVVLKPSYPKKLFSETKIWLADGVAAAFECKNTINASHLKTAVEAAQKVKLLSRPKKRTPVNELRPGIFYGVLAHSHSWKSKKSKPIECVKKSLKPALNAVQHPRLLLDVVCIADLACWAQKFRIEPNLRGSEPWPIQGQPAFRIDTVLERPEYEANTFTEKFKPLGSFLTHVINLLALHDEQTRDIAKCFDQVFTQGSFSNDWGRRWGQDVLSTRVRDMLPQQFHPELYVWDGWQNEF
jgi:hypothetical protein